MDHVNYEVGEVIETYVYREEGVGHSDIIMFGISAVFVIIIGCYVWGRVVGNKLKKKK